MKVKRKSPIYQAIQWLGDNKKELKDLLGCRIEVDKARKSCHIYYNFITIQLQHTDWIIVGNNRLERFTNDEFQQCFEGVE